MSARRIKLPTVKLTKHKRKAGVGGNVTGVVSLNASRARVGVAMEITYLGEEFLSTIKSTDDLEIEVVIKKKEKS